MYGSDDDNHYQIIHFKHDHDMIQGPTEAQKIYLSTAYTKDKNRPDYTRMNHNRYTAMVDTYRTWYNSGLVTTDSDIAAL